MIVAVNARRTGALADWSTGRASALSPQREVRPVNSADRLARLIFVPWTVGWAMIWNSCVPLAETVVARNAIPARASWHVLGTIDSSSQAPIALGRFSSEQARCQPAGR